MYLMCMCINGSETLLSLASRLPSSDHFSTPVLMVSKGTNSYQVQRTSDDTNNPIVVGYEVTRFGVQMIGEYVNAGRKRSVPISLAVPGAQYRITAWAHGGGNRSETPAVEHVTTGEARECDMYFLMCMVEYS